MVNETLFSYTVLLVQRIEDGDIDNCTHLRIEEKSISATNNTHLITYLEAEVITQF